MAAAVTVFVPISPRVVFEKPLREQHQRGSMILGGFFRVFFCTQHVVFNRSPPQQSGRVGGGLYVQSAFVRPFACRKLSQSELDIIGYRGLVTGKLMPRIGQKAHVR